MLMITKQSGFPNSMIYETQIGVTRWPTLVVADTKHDPGVSLDDLVDGHPGVFLHQVLSPWIRAAPRDKQVSPTPVRISAAPPLAYVQQILTGHVQRCQLVSGAHNKGPLTAVVNTIKKSWVCFVLFPNIALNVKSCHSSWAKLSRKWESTKFDAKKMISLLFFPFVNSAHFIQNYCKSSGTQPRIFTV